jgi:cell division protein ZapA
MADGTTVTVKILDKEYQVSCERGEVADLRQSASYVDDKMREFKEKSTVIGYRLAVMVALNIANDFFGESKKIESVASDHSENLKTLSGKLDQALLRIKKSAT